MSRIKELIRTTAAKGAKPLRMARALAWGIRQAGGVRLVSRKVINIYRREGVAGIRRGIGAFRHAIRNRSGLNRNNYAAWVLQYDTLTDEARKEMARLGNGLRTKPLISIIMPVYNPAPDWLREAIESVRSQIYSEWELCIADDASTDPAIRDVLQHYQSLDPRIKVVFRAANGHISAASNSALEIAGGDWIALFDHDDLLSAHALFWMVEAINRSPGAGLLYSDEDKITENGVRTEPHFKCEWNYELFLSYNMISHLGLYRADLVREVGRFRLGFEGAQDYDLALRCIERLAPSQIVHVPRVLYHWRIHSASTAQAGDSKPYALLAGERALNEHIQRVGLRARAELQPRGYYRVRFDLPVAQPLVSLIIPTRNGEMLVRQCIDSILHKTTYRNYEILLVDNGSDDPAALAYFQELAQHPRIRVIRDDRPFNYSALNNGAVAQANGEYVGLVNNDIEVISPDWLAEMMSYAIQPGVGAVGARLLYPDRTVQHAGVILGLGGVAGHSHKHFPADHPGYFFRAILTQELSAVTAACLVVRKETYRAVGGLEERALTVAFNDIDFCIRLKQAGYRNIYASYAELYHHESVTRGAENTPDKRARFQAECDYMKSRWADLLGADPAYSPNLTQDYEDFSYAWPTRVPPLSASPILKNG